MLWSLVMALSQTRLYNCWQLTNKESGHCQPSPPPPPSFFLLLRSVGIYIYIHFFRRGSAAGPCVLSYIYTTGPCTTTTINHPSTLILTCPAAAVAPKLRVSTHHYSVEKCVPHTHTEREKSGRFETSKVCAASTFFFVLFCRR